MKKWEREERREKRKRKRQCSALVLSSCEVTWHVVLGSITQSCRETTALGRVEGDGEAVMWG